MKCGLLLAVLVMAGCGAPPTDAVVLECYVIEDACPSQEQVADAVDIFADIAGLERTAAPLVVGWHSPGERFYGGSGGAGVPFYVDAITDTPDRVRVTGWAYLSHELMHVTHWRKDGSPDANHEEAPGPWTTADNVTIDEIAAKYAEMFIPL